MSKVEILRLDSVTTNDTKATALINTNFQNIQNVIETLLSRTGATPNYMDAVLDMNSYRIINTAAPVEDFDVVNLKYLKDYVGNLESLVNQALEAAEAALVNAQNAAGSANVAASASQTAIEARDAAVDAAILAQGIERDIEGLLNDPNLVAVGEDLRDPDGKINTVLDAAQELIDGEYGCGLEFEDSYLQLLDKNGEALGDPVLINQGNYKGEYSATTTYNTGDYVHYTNPWGFFLCIAGPATGIAPEGDILSRATWRDFDKTAVRPASDNAGYHIALAGDPYIQYPSTVFLYASENAPKINASTGDIIGYAKTTDIPDVSDFVTKSTDQTITGQKKFSHSLTRTSTIDPTTTTGETEVRTLSTVTNNGSTVVASYNATRSGTNFSNRQRVNNPNVSNGWYDIRVNLNDDGQGYVNVACSQSVTNLSNTYITNSTGTLYLPTMGWCNNASIANNIAHKSGTETFSGDKSFTGTVTAVTQTAGDNSTKVATTAYADRAATSASNFKGEYDATATYNTGDYVWWVSSDHMYVCIVDNTTNVSPSATANWRDLNDRHDVNFVEKSDNVSYKIGLVDDSYSGSNYYGPVRFSANAPKINASTGQLIGYQTTTNLVTSVDNTSTDSQYPSAKLFYDTCGDIETLINAL